MGLLGVPTGQEHRRRSLDGVACIRPAGRVAVITRRRVAHGTIASVSWTKHETMFEGSSSTAAGCVTCGDGSIQGYLLPTKFESFQRGGSNLGP